MATMTRMTVIMVHHGARGMILGGPRMVPGTQQTLYKNLLLLLLLLPLSQNEIKIYIYNYICTFIYVCVLKPSPATTLFLKLFPPLLMYW